MKKEFDDIICKFMPPSLAQEDREEISNFITIKEVPSETILLSEGDIASKLFMVIKGCLRGYFIKENGDEITAQFFIEGRMVSSFESMMTGTPSRVYIDTVEDSILGIIQKKDLKKLIDENSKIKDHFDKVMASRLIYYMNHHASFILDNPEKRYQKFSQDNPELVTRLPKRYIASYLGITPVSLSRIRTRLKNRINNC